MIKEIIISPKVNSWPNWRELWQFRELLSALVKRDLKIRYRETVLGVFWVILQPTLVTTIFSVIFGKIAKLPTDGLPYPVFSYMGIIVWNFFSSGVLTVSNCLLSASGMVQRVNFSHLILPFSAISPILVDFFVSLLPLTVLLLYFGIAPQILFFSFLPILLILLVGITLGAGMILAPISIRFRDMRFLLNFLMQIGLFVTPVIYPLSAVTDYRRTILALNPLAGIIENFRSLLGQSAQVNGELLLTSVIMGFVLFVFGAMYFVKNEKAVIELM